MNSKRIDAGRILGFIIAYWSVTASFFSDVIPSVFSLLLLGLFLVIMIINTTRIVPDGRLLLACIALIIPYLRKDGLSDVTNWYGAFVYPAIIIFVYYSYKFDEWENMMFRIMNASYFFYALYTIFMAVSDIAIYISCGLFPLDARLMLVRYNLGKFCGLTNHYSTNGMLLAVGVVLSGCKLLQEKRIKNIIFFGVYIVAILLTGKRAQPIFSVFGVIVAYYFYNSDKKQTRILKMGMLAISILVIVYLIIQYVPALSVMFNRFAELEESGNVSNGRYDLWAIALDAFKESPLFGIGWGKYRLLQINGWDAHNVYIQLLCENGIIGFLAYFVWFLYFLIKSLWLLVQQKTRGIYLDSKEEYSLLFSISMQVFFLLNALTENPIYYKIMFVPYFAACAIVAKVGRVYKASME